MENLDLNQGVLCEIENTEYGTVVTFPADLNLQELTEPLHLFEPGESYPQQQDSGNGADGNHRTTEDEEGRNGVKIESEATSSNKESSTRNDSRGTLENANAGDETSFPELGSIIELETDDTAQADGEKKSEPESGQKYGNGYQSQEALPKKWDAKKTLALIKCIRKHQYYFKASSVQRISLWNGISEELSKKGFDECNRDECRKKWDNLYRTFRKISQRESEKVTWELYEPVKEAVKCLGWDVNINGDNVKRKRADCSSAELNVIQKIMKLNEEFHDTINKKHASFFEEINILEEEKKSILSKIQKLMSNNL